MRVVLDTNVLLAAFAARGLCEAVLAVCLEGHELVLSQHILRESRRHQVGKFKVPARQADDIVLFLREQATLVKPAKVSAKACRDRSDLAVLGTALAAKADCLVTGDKDLLALGRFRSTRILSPRAFHDALR